MVRGTHATFDRDQAAIQNDAPAARIDENGSALPSLRPLERDRPRRRRTPAQPRLLAPRPSWTSRRRVTSIHSVGRQFVNLGVHCMRVVLADLKSIAGSSAKTPSSAATDRGSIRSTRVTTVIAYCKKQFHDVPSVHMAYIAAILARAGHDVKWTRGDSLDGDVALVLSSLVDHKAETAWADQMRARGVNVGFIGITASKMPRALRGSLRLHPERRARGGGDAARAGRDAERHRRQRADRRSRFAAVPAVGSGHRGSRPQVRHQVVVAAGRRRLSAAREPRLPGVLHLLPAPDPRRLSRPVDRRTSSTRSSGCAIRCRSRT